MFNTLGGGGGGSVHRKVIMMHVENIVSTLGGGGGEAHSVRLGDIMIHVGEQIDKSPDVLNIP